MVLDDRLDVWDDHAAVLPTRPFLCFDPRTGADANMVCSVSGYQDVYLNFLPLFALSASSVELCCTVVAQVGGRISVGMPGPRDLFDHTWLRSVHCGALSAPRLARLYCSCHYEVGTGTAPCSRCIDWIQKYALPSVKGRMYPPISAL
jgi:hypothetical protein